MYKEFLPFLGATCHMLPACSKAPVDEASYIILVATAPSHEEEKADRSTIVQAPRAQLRYKSASQPKVARLQRNMQVIIQPERPVAVRAFPRSRQGPFLDALVAEDVPAGLDNRVFEILLAHGTYCHNLATVSGV